MTQGVDFPQGDAGPLRAEPVLLRGISKSYDGSANVVDALNLDVGAGEFLTILGPSGSGKTSILMMLAGFERPSAGSIRIGERDVSILPPHRRNIGMVFQHYALFPHLTIAQNLAYPLQARRWARQDVAERVEWALSLVRLTAMGSRHPSQLSGGQQQRIALARALIYNPQLVLMDEPLGALDKQLRDQMQDEIIRIHRKLGPTIIYVTHDQGEALSLSDRVCVFEGGRIAQIGAPTDLYEAPTNAFVAGFLGENNAIGGIFLSSDGDRCHVRLKGGEIVCAINIGNGSYGEPVSLAIRPERVKAVPEGSPNVLHVEVIDATYLGDSHRVRSRASDGTEIIWKLPNCGGQALPTPGETIRLGWRTEDARAFPAPRI
ncbi:ABC transporter ATP-binding protein [Labrys okinawensis]|uniref:ABC transporter ATP-binding protein n=1 Tax=Labrys okinawensis TaxID=346911 RepID=UPI0039BC9E61